MFVVLTLRRSSAYLRYKTAGAPGRLPVISDGVLRPMKCDFCSEPTVVKLYGKPTGDPPDLVIRVIHGQWTACRECVELIESERWEGLIDRSVVAIRTKYGLRNGTARELREEVRRFHERFRKLMQEQHVEALPR
jgi:hypothetical protein